MAMTMEELNYTTRIGSFVVDSSSELSKLPNMTSCGSDNLHSISKISVGSTAYVIAEKKNYILNGSNTWVEYSTSTGGGGGGGYTPTIATTEDIQNIFNAN